MAGTITAGAAAFGARFLRTLLPESGRMERLVFGAGLGLGAVSLLVLGAAHISVELLPVILIGCAVSLIILREEFRGLPGLPDDPFCRWVLAALAVVFVFNLLGCFLPPLDYDVIEYHLGAPAEYLRAGRMHFLEHNMYSSFPSNVEMLYLLALKLGGLPFEGAVIAKVLNLFLVTLSAAAVYLLGRAAGGRRAGVVAAAALYVHPVMIGVAMRAYVEGALVLYTVMALYGVMSFVRTGNRLWAVVAGLSAGLAAGCKYTAIPFVLVPVVIYAVVAGGPRKGISGAAVAALCFACVFAPWALRNTINTGNPVFPLAHEVFGSRCWNEELDARFDHAHSPMMNKDHAPDAAEQGREFIRRLAGVFTGTNSGSFLFLIFIPLAFLLRAGPRFLVPLLGHFLWCFVIWFAVTHRIDRFLAAALPGLCVAAGVGAAAALDRASVTRWAVGVCLLVATLTTVLAHIGSGTLRVASGIETEKEWLKDITRGASYSSDAVDYINDLPAGSKVLLIGEAEVYYFDTPIVYSVVFNDNLIEDLISDRSSARDRLVEKGITHVFVNWPEFGRLRKTYSYPYRGERMPGYLPHMSLEAIRELFRLFSLQAAWGREAPGSGRHPWELFAVAGDVKKTQPVFGTLL